MHVGCRWVYNILQTISTTLFSMHVLVEQELPTLSEHLNSALFLVGFVLFDL
jgi:hypothetical protein